MKLVCHYENTSTSFIHFPGPCFKGARIIMACRDVERAEDARTDILEDTGNENIIIRKLDLSDKKSIRAFAQLINKGRQVTLNIETHEAYKWIASANRFLEKIFGGKDYLVRVGKVS